MMRKIKIITAALMMMLCLASCKNSEPIGQATTSLSAEIVTEDVTSAEENSEISKSGISTAINPLTGENNYNESAIGKRPVAVMISNIKAALPQYGIDDADIIYELPVEGGITRLMAVYADYTNVPDVCSVRSCRYYYPILAYGMDAIYCHWGTDKTIALDTLNYLDIDRFDGNESSLGFGTVFERDEYREQYYDTEHTGCLRGSELEEAIKDMEYRTDINEENENGAFIFNAPDSPVVPEGEDCKTADLNYSTSYYSTFEYDSESKTYLKYHSGSPHNDGVTGNQLAFTNVFILETYVSERDDGKLMDVSLDGGYGTYISMGKAQSITWEKNYDSDPIKMYDENDDELKINAGKIYIGFIESSKVSY